MLSFILKQIQNEMSLNSAQFYANSLSLYLLQDLFNVVDFSYVFPQFVSARKTFSTLITL